VDADGHILESKDLWQTYLEPKYWDRALCIETDDRGFEHWVVNGRPCDYRYGVFGDMGAIGKKLERYFTPRPGHLLRGPRPLPRRRRPA
jgi:hypothetical protein